MAAAEGMSISGSTGISASYQHHDGGPSSIASFSLGVFRSELTLNLYF